MRHDGRGGESLRVMMGTDEGHDENHDGDFGRGGRVGGACASSQREPDGCRKLPSRAQSNCARGNFSSRRWAQRSATHMSEAMHVVP